MAVAENEEEGLRNFLESISGLESLYLSLPSPTDTKALWRTAVRHKATIRRFIYHARSVNLDDESELFEEEMDLNDMALLSDSFLAHLRSVDEDSDEEMKFESDAWFTEQSPNPLGELYLECIGLACHPRRLVFALLSPGHVECAVSNMDLERGYRALVSQGQFTGPAYQAVRARH